MGNKDKNKIIRIYGITLASADSRTRAYGHGRTKLKIDKKECWVEYVDYYIEDLVACIHKAGRQKEFNKEALKQKNDKTNSRS